MGYLFSSLAELGPTLGVVLFQLPPSFRRDLDRLERFLLALPADAPVAFEFRHRSWSEDAVEKRLREHGAAWVVVDDAGEPESIPVTGSTTYLRLRNESFGKEDLLA